jgi:DNA polymerase III epsilon subunit-like protein
MKKNKFLWVSVDVESDGPCPALYSMVSFGAVVVEPTLNRTFYGETAPISESYIPEALAVSGISRSQHEKFPEPRKTMLEFSNWLDSLEAERFVFVTDNLSFDWQFINYYMHRYLMANPFGFSGRRINDIYSGLVGSGFSQNEWKRLYRKTAHSHHPVDDAKGNAEALLAFKDKLNFKF